MSMKSTLSLMTVALFGAWLVACGGGSSGGSGGGIRASEEPLIVQVNSNGSASFFQTVPGQENRMLAAVRDFLISDAMAQTGVEVCVYSGAVQVACQTTVGGKTTFFLAPGTYDICIDPAVPNGGTCGELVDVTVESLTTVTVVCNAECEVTDVSSQDLSTVEHVTICHYPPGNPNNPQTISVGAPAVPPHTAQHGDTVGECPAPTLAINSNPNAGGNNPNNPNNQP